MASAEWGGLCIRSRTPRRTTESRRGGGLFLPFADATAGSETYGGGRYLLDGIKGADLGFAGGRLIADFNFAYKPSCSYLPAWVCPLAPPENRLPAPVPAGERMPGTLAA